MTKLAPPCLALLLLAGTLSAQSPAPAPGSDRLNEPRTSVSGESSPAPAATSSPSPTAPSSAGGYPSAPSSMEDTSPSPSAKTLEICLTAQQPKLAATATPQDFLNHPFAVLSSQLSPAVLVHSSQPKLNLFANLAAWGLGSPTHLAVPTSAGVKLFAPDQPIDTSLSESWLLCWFAGSQKWDLWDVPVLVVLQHKPTAIQLSAQGLELSFPAQAGVVAVMPLFGYDKLPLTPAAPTDSPAPPNLAGRNQSTQSWQTTLPPDVAARCRYFSRLVRAYPVYCHEQFALDGSDVVIRFNFQWLQTPDDWHTPPLKLAPLPPTLGLAWWAGQHSAKRPFPVVFDAPLKDIDLMTPYGPLVGAEGVDQLTLRLAVMPYVQFAPVVAVPAPDDPLLGPVLNRLRQTMDQKFKTGSWEEIWDHELSASYGGPGLYCWQVMNDRWYGLAMPFVTEPVRARMRSTLTGYLRQWVLKEERFQPLKDMLLLVGPGINTWGGYDDAGKFSANLLDTIYHLVSATEQWDLVAEHWPLLKRLFITPLEADWRGFGRYGIAEMGDEAPPALAFARLAWQVGDHDAYAYGCYVFARELVHHYVKQVGAEYFRRHQPYHSMEPMTGSVWLTNLWGETAGWQIDGPDYPKETGERQSNNRWVRFSSYEVARFYRDFLPAEVRAEMDELTARSHELGDDKVFYQLRHDTAHIAPSLLRLRAMLTDESPSTLLSLVPLAQWRVDLGADVAAMAVSVMRAGPEQAWQRLIPDVRSNFVLGLERGRDVWDDSLLDLAVRIPYERRVYARMRHYPALCWFSWRSPFPVRGWPAGKTWSFGQIIPQDYVPQSVTDIYLNWTTRLWLFALEPYPQDAPTPGSETAPGSDTAPASSTAPATLPATDP
ncbi:MAG: hypothetical protein IT443_00110 [Phycisphaeraceae bacterium]|nr:hypothetical protein [Phycisphaeraceae bacterium]